MLELEEMPPNCVGFAMYTLGFGPDKFYRPTEVPKYFVEAGDEPAIAVVARTRIRALHIVPYNPIAPNCIDHRPNTGLPIKYGDTFYDAIGWYADRDPTIYEPVEIVFMKKKTYWWERKR